MELLVCGSEFHSPQRRAVLTTFRQADRQADRQTDRQTDRRTDRRTDRQTDRQTEMKDLRTVAKTQKGYQEK